MVERLTEIDELTLPKYYYLGPEDRCYYIGEYTPRENFGYSQTNDIIHNFKKTVDRKGRPEWRYKGEAIHKIADTFRSVLNDEWLEIATIVPMPPSKVKSDSMYDDRLLQMLTKMCQGLVVDIRELITQDISLMPSHVSANRLSPDDLLEHYQLDEDLIEPEPRVVGIFDDILTTGAHYRVAKDLLTRQFPGLEVIGFFFARVVRPEPNFEDIFGI